MSDNDRVPSWMKFVGLWGVAAIAALALSWVAVSQVRDRVIQPVTVIPTTIVAARTETPDPTVVVVEPTVGDRPGPALSSSTTSIPRDSGSDESATSSTRAPSASPATTTTTGASQATSTMAPPVTTTTPPPPTTTTAPPANLGTSSHSTPGGSVTISSAPGQVNFVSAIPQAGFTTELRDIGPDRVRVRFVSATTIFEFEAQWDDGRLDIETSEHTP